MRQLEDPENPNDPGEQDQIDAEELINEVQLHDVIYNKQNKLHSRITSTEAAWVKLQKPSVQLLSKWAKLRRCYRDALAKENLPSGSGAARGRKKFPFMAQLEFLREYMMKKPNTV
ncbi:hypothetical protein quinque_009449 [Culex quinquefasciatus]|nr:uncharacterized protein LOC119767058 isoform X2 [Culex quinquefasciatus]